MNDKNDIYCNFLMLLFQQFLFSSSLHGLKNASLPYKIQNIPTTKSEPFWGK